MWEAIHDNVRRSRLLIGFMGALLVGLGAVFGMAYAGADGAVAGAIAALAMWLILWLVATAGGEQVVLMSARARQIRKEDSPRLWNVVEEMTIASGLGTLPKIYIIDNEMPNAFATGRKPENGCVAVTSGLLRRLSRDELQGVIAHEIAHIKNLDVRFMTIAAVMVGSIVMIADIFLRSMWFGGGRRSGGKGGQGQIIVLVLALAAAILAPIFAQILYFACSRKREFLADASAARFTRYPEGLASALEKISGSLGNSGKQALRSLAPMYIINPLQAAKSSAGLFSTHPATQRRVAILRAMGGNAGWVDYERAYKKVTGSREACLGQKTLASEKSVSARAASPEAGTKQDAVARAREVTDLIDRLAEFLVIGCVCGVRIKVPPNLDRESLRCPKCGRTHEVPRAEQDAQADKPAAPAQGPSAEPLRYRRQGRGWESFKCSCGKVQQLSPAFEVRAITCRKCHRKIEIAGP
jgi:heat shock protein HtpX